jgi:group I intron endonuclease
MPFIYKTVNNINEKIYIGKANKNDPSYLGSGLKIVAAVKKYGRISFSKEIIEECSEDIVQEREKYWIKFYNSTDDIIGYNISSGGEGGDHYWTTLSTTDKIEHNRKISESRKGRARGPHSEETKKKIKDNQPSDPEWHRNRAEKKRKFFTIIDHLCSKIYFTKNLKEFSITHHLNYDNMLYNARVKKTLYELRWSCRKGKLEGSDKDIIQNIDTEIRMAASMIKAVVGKHSKKGEKNPMFNKTHTEISKQKIRDTKRKKNEKS